MKTIGGVAKELKINVETIRYYEREGLIQQPIKPDIGYRKYDKDTTDQINFIINAKLLGFSLDEIKSLLDLSDSCSDVKELGIKKLELIRKKIQELKKLEKSIIELTDDCNRNIKNSSCPIIESLKTLDSVP